MSKLMQDGQYYSAIAEALKRSLKEVADKLVDEHVRQIEKQLLIVASNKLAELDIASMMSLSEDSTSLVIKLRPKI
jgi:predicted deacylase